MTSSATVTAPCVWTADCLLGEGCVWDAPHQRLLFVDIKQPAVLAWTPATGQRQRWPMPEMIGWLVPRARGSWVAGFASGVALLEWETWPQPGAANAAGGDGATAMQAPRGHSSPLLPPRLTWLHRLHPAGSPMRLNDAKADAQGRLWFGSMNNADESRPDGRFYRLDVDGSLHQVDEGYGVTNGPAFSLDGRTLFHTDSAARCIYAFDVDPNGALSRRRIWKRIEGAEADEGWPDGMCIDAEDHLWVARWGAGCVTRLDPDGHEVSRVLTGAPRTTNCAFGGAGFSRLFITSARIGLDAAALTLTPASGGLFVADDVGRGMAPGVWRG